MELGSRALFPDLQPRVYLNHAAIAPPSTLVREAVRRHVDSYARLGVGAFHGSMELRARLKRQLVELMGVTGGAEDVAFGTSTSRALADAALCLDWQPGDRALLFEGEFPANVTPWVQAARALGAEVEFVPQDLDAVEAALRRGSVRVIAVSEVQFQTGRRMPTAALTRLAHAHGALVAVDVIQALGCVPLSLGEVDLVAGAGHKWAMGLEGCGFLYVRPGTKLVPRVAGWWSHVEPVDFLFEGPGRLRYDKAIREQGDALELGTVSGIGAAAMEAGLAPMAALGIEAVHEHIQAWHDRVEPLFVQQGFVSLRGPVEERSGSLCFEHADVLGIAHRLGEAGVSVSTPDGRLRLAPHWCNPLDEVDLLAEVLPSCL